MTRVSAILITLNAERDLPRALASLQTIADEILVVDAGSKDRTREIAAAAGARVIEREWTDYSDQRNFAAGQASHDWILTIDADEELSPRLRDSLAEWKRGEAHAAAYRMARLANYLGRWIHHSGWYPDYKVRLYRRDAGRYVGTVHESPRVKGETGMLAGDILHYAYRTREEHAAKVEKYTDLAAQQAFAAGRRSWRAAAFVAPPWAFLRAFLLQQGFRDGAAGWRIAWMAARYVRRKYQKLGVLARGGHLERSASARGAKP